MDKVPSIKFCG